MKRIFAAALCLCLIMTACAQSDGQPSASGQGATPNAAASDISDGHEGEPALYFCGEIPDPQSMAPSYEAGTLSFEGAFYPDGNGGYEAALSLMRHFPQGIDFITGEPQPEGYMNLSYHSFGNAAAAELSPETKAELDEKSVDDGGQRQYGFVSMNLRSTAFTMQTTGSFYLPINYERQYCSQVKLPYLLSVDGSKALLYLQLNPFATVRLEGALTAPPIPTPQKADGGNQTLYFNDEGHTPEIDNKKDIWNILFLGEKSGESFDGTLRLWRWREQTGSSPTNLCYIPGDASYYEQALSLSFQPFLEEVYLSAGGKLNLRQRAALSGMASVDCGGQTVLFTLCGNEVYAELPHLNIGAFTGHFTDDNDIERIHEESLMLYECAHSYHMSPLSPAAPDMQYSMEQSSGMMQGNAQAALSLEHAQMTTGSPSGVPGFIPDEFIRAVNPTDFLEKRPATLIFGNYQYLDDGNWLDVTGPIYRQQLSGMRELKIEEGETSEGTGYEMEISFRYGNRTVGYYLADTPAGTSVSIFIY